jgi:hypothetical protein
MSRRTARFIKESEMALLLHYPARFAETGPVGKENRGKTWARGRWGLVEDRHDNKRQSSPIGQQPNRGP